MGRSCSLALVCLAMLGCGRAPTAEPAAVADEPATPAFDTVPDLRTRKKGTDWPHFLGPTGDSVSSEKGIIAPWSREGLRLVWQRRLGVGYGMPSISKGRLYLFDRHGDQARLSCLKSET